MKFGCDFDLTCFEGDGVSLLKRSERGAIREIDLRELQRP